MLKCIIFAAQQLAHHTTSGCAMNVGDLLDRAVHDFRADQREPWQPVGTVLGGKEPFAIAGGTRSFIEDNDTLTYAARRRTGADGYRIGFGSCTGKVIPALKDLRSGAKSASSPVAASL